MSYLVLARKWRPQGFGDLIGQQPIVRILTNSIAQDKIAHAYIFSGPRGVGKTSTARILAKALNCHEGPTAEPCGSCPSCQSVTDGHSVDVIEIDGASNNSVDDVRDLRERVKYAPSGGKFKVYIIDEVHMLSASAFNALLKTLEEPPPHVIFVMATTEPRKIPLTVLSRCQHLPFRRVSTSNIKQRLEQITKAEGISISVSALGLIARAADGSIRDSLTILDQVASFATEISDVDVMDLLGISDTKDIIALSGAVLTGERERIIGAVSELVERGTDLRAFTRDLIKFFRDLIVVKLSSSPEGLIDAGEDDLRQLKDLAAGASLEHLSVIITELLRAEMEVKGSFSPRVALEMALIRLSFLDMMLPISDAVTALEGSSKTNSIIKSNDEDKPAGQVASKPPAPSPPLAEKTLPPVEPAPAEAPAPPPEDDPVEESVSEAPVDEQAPAYTEPEDDAAEPSEDTEPEGVEAEPESVDVETGTAQGAGAAPGGEVDPVKLLEEIIASIEDPRLSSKLAKAEPSYSNGLLGLAFSESDSTVCAGAAKDNSKAIASLASKALGGKAVKVEVVTLGGSAAGAPESRAETKARAVAEPTVKEAMDLFGARVVDVKNIEDDST